MAVKVYTLVKDSFGFPITLPSGLNSLTATQNIRMKFRKPSGTILMNNLVAGNIVAGTLNVNVTFSNGQLDEEGIYDYEMTDTTMGIEKKGKLLQFTVTREITE